MGVGGGVEICGGCSWTPRPGGGESPVVGLRSLWGVLRCTLNGWVGGDAVGVCGWGVGRWGCGRGGIGDGVEFKGRCLVDGWGRARAIWIRL